MQLKISGRLGNQLFQYATVKAFKVRNNLSEKILISFEQNDKYLKKDESFGDSLKYFNVSDYEIIEKVSMNFLQKFVFSLYRVNRKIINSKSSNEYYSENIKLQKKWQKCLNKFGIYHFLYGYYEFKLSKSKNKIFEGFFESYKYFDDIKDELRKEFTPKKAVLKKNLELYNKIINTNSICVTIRRGDFLNSNNKKRFYICTPQYFYNAIERIKKLVNNPQFVVFSDDIEWCKENMDFPEGTLYEDGNDPVWEKLRLMYSCKHFIISNSTFSWWAQYLSSNDKKIVIAPKVWSNTGDYWKDLYDSKWILM